MSKSNSCETDLLELIFDNTAWGTIAAVGALTDLYVSLHTGDPGEAGDQTTNEIGYTSYARVAVTRGSGWTVAGNTVNPAAAITFPAGTGGAGTATHFGVGTAASGAGQLLYSGEIDPDIVCGDGVTPQLTTATAITED